MSEQLYGLSKLALLNTAGYAKCVIPLDKSASICAPNNTGKSSVINALQFPLINDLRLTEWDGHDLEETRKFYFSSDQSYILLEANLPHGDVVIGVAGLGKIAGYAHQFFCYQGKLNLDDYTQGKSIIKYTKLFNHLQEKQLKPVELKAQELNALLTGGATPFDGDINLKMIPLNNVQDAPVYKEIFRRILNLHKLGAQDVKRFMLKVFERHMSNSKVDFYEVWRRAFDKVNRARRELNALESMQEPISALEKMLENEAVLKGKLAAYAPKLDLALVEYDNYHNEQIAELATQLEDIEAEKREFESKQQLYVQQSRDIERKQTQIEQWFTDFHALKREFELTNHATLKTNLTLLKKEYEQLSFSINSAQGQSLHTLDFRINETQKQIKSLKLQLKNLEFNLFTRMREDLSLKEVEEISRILNPDLLSFSTTSQGEIDITDEDAFGAFLESLSKSVQGGELKVPGANVKLKKLSPVQMQSGENKAQLQAQLESLQQSLNDLKQQREVAANVAEKQKERDALYDELMATEAAMKRFEQYQTMLQSVDAQQALKEQLEMEREQVDEYLHDIQRNAGSISDRRSIIKSKQDLLVRQADRLKQVKSERIDHTLDLYSGKLAPYEIEINLDFDNLSEVTHQFNKDCNELRNLDVNVRNTYLHIYNAGITKFENESDVTIKYQKLISAYHNLYNERDAVDKQARVALTEVAATIKGLRQDLDRLRREMNSFNKGISQHRISNLQAFKINVIPRKMLIDSIDTIISTSDLYEKGESLDLLSEQPSSEKSVNEAKDHIIKLASDKAGLTLTDLFDIRFEVVNRAGDIEHFDKIDSAGSNGTRITIKLLCGMLFIRYLLSDQEQAMYRIPIYIDEAADIDPQNQKAIIETALSFGFVPIFASVKPQISCDYLVPIRSVAQGSQNWVDEKDWIEVEH
ncbi:ATPase [Pseudoalteromonas sp. L23]|uniref:ATPase n=1 Tax=unclassified Pseudoalteromonas TaxID=194690 RepID=UPI001F2F9749|nr:MULTISPECIES: ATPase [unclassified Pseudoalteromonas]MCF2826663.1 ATPase [Pseudoalteromonas sp. OF5H-5]MCF2834396.1 ATPase [Pseudoalteromonas sp. DL2-H6]MCF2926476.1 ATPase [Pseudoalteromonas sp. DL2-H1]MCF7513275.1 ATPase [Pseudoalteromonas sp. L7]MCF7525315.1 ATPase [Pseudoalteromonas sp. L23]